MFIAHLGVFQLSQRAGKDSCVSAVYGYSAWETSAEWRLPEDAYLIPMVVPFLNACLLTLNSMTGAVLRASAKAVSRRRDLLEKLKCSLWRIQLITTHIWSLKEFYFTLFLGLSLEISGERRGNSHLFSCESGSRYSQGFESFGFP